MNRLKIISKTLIIFVLVLTVVITRVSLADSGFDYSYSGGSSGGSSSYSGGSSYSSSGSNSGSTYYDPHFDATMTFVMILVIVLTVLMMPVLNAMERKMDEIKYLMKNKKRIESERREQSRVLAQERIKREKIEGTFEKIAELNSSLDRRKLVSLIKKAYIKLQKCYSNHNLDEIRKITSDNLYEFYKLRFHSFDTKKEYHIISVDEVKSVYINSINLIDRNINMDVSLTAKETSYYIDDKKYIISGDSNYKLYSYFLGLDVNIDTEEVKFNTKLVDYKNTNNHEIFIEDLLSIDENLTKENIINKAFEVYENLQYAWSNFDYEEMRKLVSDELYNNYKLQLDTLKIKNQRNVMEDIKYIGGTIRDYSINNKKLYISLELIVTQRDYIINTDKNKVVRGNKEENMVSYRLYLEKGIDDKKLDKCPNCGAPLNDSASQKCISCGADIVDVSKDFIIVKKEIIRQ